MIISSMTGEKLHETVLPVLPDTEEGLVEAPVIRDICINYDGGQCRYHIILREYDICWL